MKNYLLIVKGQNEVMPEKIQLPEKPSAGDYISNNGLTSIVEFCAFNLADLTTITIIANIK